jgi:hypothetical protein
MAEANAVATWRNLPFTPLQGFLNGFLQTGGSAGQVLAAMIAVQPAQIRYAVAAAQGGGTTYVLDLLLNGVSVWTNPSDRLTLTGANAGKFASGRINHSAVQVGDTLELVVATAGNKSRLVATVALEDPSQRPP